jgi:hypothetical protein
MKFLVDLGLDRIHCFKANPTDFSDLKSDYKVTYISFSWGLLKVCYSPDTGGIYIKTKEGVLRYKLINATANSQDNLPKSLSKGWVLEDLINRMFYHLSKDTICKAFEFPTIPKKSQYNPAPHPKG